MEVSGMFDDDDEVGERSYVEWWGQTVQPGWLHALSHALLVVSGIAQAALSVMVLTIPGAPRMAYHVISLVLGFVAALVAGGLLAMTFHQSLTVLVETCALIGTATLLLIFNSVYTAVFASLTTKLGVSCSRLPNTERIEEIWPDLVKEMSRMQLNPGQMYNLLRQEQLLKTNPQLFCSRLDVYIPFIWITFAFALVCLLGQGVLLYFADARGVVLKFKIPQRNLLTEIKGRQCPRNEKRFSDVARLASADSSTIHSHSAHSDYVASDHKARPAEVYHHRHHQEGARAARAHAYDQPIPGFYAAGMIHEGYHQQHQPDFRPATSQTFTGPVCEPWLTPNIIADGQHGQLGDYRPPTI